MIKLLALDPTHRLHREHIANQLWPELNADAARNNLHQVLHAARKALSTIGVDGGAALALHDDLVALGPDRQVVTDLEEFQDAVERASGDGTALAAALGRWPGELLPEDVYEPWAQRHVNRIREWRTKLVMDLVEDGLAERDPHSAVPLVAPVVAANPLHEPAHRAMMRALAGAGRNARWSAKPTPRSELHVHHAAGAMARVPAAETAFAQRSSPYILNVIARSVDGAGFASDVSWARDARAALAPYGPDTMYVNFTGEAGEDKVRASYPPETYARLVEIKNRYDPTNVFRLNQNIPPGQSPAPTSAN